MEKYVASAFEVVFPAIKILAMLALPAAIIPATFNFMKLVKDRLDVSDSIAPTSKVTEPEEKVYYSERDLGYWVRMPDGTKTLVDMSELYPNDAAYHKRPSERERFGTFIYDNVQKRMVRK